MGPVFYFRIANLGHEELTGKKCITFVLKPD